MDQTMHLGGEAWFFRQRVAGITEHSVKYSPYAAEPIHTSRSLCICFCRQTEPTDSSHRPSQGAQGGMKSDERRKAIKRQREQLIQDLEAVYLAAFDRLGELEGEVGEVKAAQLTQMILNSKTAAIEPLEKEIEKPVITTPGEA